MCGLYSSNMSADVACGVLVTRMQTTKQISCASMTMLPSAIDVSGDSEIAVRCRPQAAVSTHDVGAPQCCIRSYH